MRLHNKIQVLNLLNHHIGVYPTPMNINWNWSWGSLSGLVLASQIVTGILLAMHYVGHVDHAFASVQHLMVDVPSGVILRYSHANGASLFFTVVYLHVLRGLYYSSGNQPREIVWISGVVILLLMVITAFIGYVLPWGQMSFWGATVITSLVTTIPIVGKQIVFWLWGGFSIDHPTLNRFYSLHYTLPFVLAGLSIFHIAALHQYGSTNPLGINTQSSTIHFGIYFLSKDLLALLFFILAFAILVFFYPEYLGQVMAVLTGNSYYYYSAMCWDNPCLIFTHTLCPSSVGGYYALDYLTHCNAISGLCPGIVKIKLSHKVARAYPHMGVDASPVTCVGRSCGPHVDQSAGNHFCTFSGFSSFSSFSRVLVSLTSPFSTAGLQKTQQKMGSSETIRTILYNSPVDQVWSRTWQYPEWDRTWQCHVRSHTGYVGKKPPTCHFAYWLAGLIDGDGSLLINKQGYGSFEVTLDLKDVTTLYYIKKTLGFGNVTKRIKVNAYRYRTAKKEYMLQLINLVNGKLLTSSKQQQLLKLCNHYNIAYIPIEHDTSLKIIQNTSWLAGFFDAEGFFNVMNNTTLAAHLSQKDRHILDQIHVALQIGHVRYDKGWKGYVFTISNKEGIRYLLKLFTTHKLHTQKCVHVHTFKRLLYFIDQKYHLKANGAFGPTKHPFNGGVGPKAPRHKVFNLIRLFKKKQAIPTVDRFLAGGYGIVKI
jgi:ubiquinol-cytochrome c reductase cytochrome b subunit